jgi:hypothetical protein
MERGQPISSAQQLILFAGVPSSDVEWTFSSSVFSPPFFDIRLRMHSRSARATELQADLQDSGCTSPVNNLKCIFVSPVSLLSLDDELLDHVQSSSTIRTRRLTTPDIPNRFGIPPRDFKFGHTTDPLFNRQQTACQVLWRRLGI